MTLSPPDRDDVDDLYQDTGDPVGRLILIATVDPATYAVYGLAAVTTDANVTGWLQAAMHCVTRLTDQERAQMVRTIVAWGCK